jgi:hypothetical protein
MITLMLQQWGGHTTAMALFTSVTLRCVVTGRTYHMHLLQPQEVALAPLAVRPAFAAAAAAGVWVSQAWVLDHLPLPAACCAPLLPSAPGTGGP